MIFVKTLIAILWYFLFGLVYYFLLDKLDHPWFKYMFQEIIDRATKDDDSVKFVPYNYLYPIVAGGFAIVWPLIMFYRVGTILRNLTKRRN
jgi:hypothetical protein